MLKQIYIATLCAVLFSGSARAETVDITTSTTIESQPSYTFDDWIFELVNPSNVNFNLINTGDFGSPEDFIVSSGCCGGDFTMRRLDNAAFDLLSLFHAGDGSTGVGGVSVVGPGPLIFETFNFAGQPGVTNVTSVLFSPAPPFSFIQLSRFEFEAPVPEPSTLLLAALALLSLLAHGRRRRA